MSQCQSNYAQQEEMLIPKIGDQLRVMALIDQDPQLKSKYFDFYESYKSSQGAPQEWLIFIKMQDLH